MSTRSGQRTAVNVIGGTETDSWVVSAAASVALALFVFFVDGDRELGMFIGLWPPTILAFASYFRLRGIFDAMDRATDGGGIVERMTGMVQGR
jgi:hypothetical protein